MKKLFIIFVLVILGSLLTATVYDDMITDVYSTGGFDTIEGSQVWAPQGILESKSMAYEYVAWVSMVFFYTWADWEQPSNSSRVSQINSIGAVVAYWYDDYDDVIYQISIPRSEIVGKFDDEDYYEYSSDELMDDILTYVNYYGDISAY